MIVGFFLPWAQLFGFGVSGWNLGQLGHLYAQGGHAFGVRRTEFPITNWPQLVETWLGIIRMTAK
jgi:hypothetical protein